jgi:hypothetical protein
VTDGVERLKTWIVEREATRFRKENNLPMDNVPDGKGGTRPIWTEDPIIGAYRFCNVRREDDRVTKWIAKNWRTPNQDDPDLWFAMLVARFINWPDTLEQLGYPILHTGAEAAWSLSKFLQVMAARKARKLKCYTGAYMVRADRDHADKAAYQEAVVFTPMWKNRYALRPKKGDTLNSYHMLLGQFHGLGSFMAAQIVADLKYVAPLSSASDWWTFAASGPGSRRGMNRVAGRKPDAPYTEDEWRADLGRLYQKLREMPLKNEEHNLLEGLHAQDIQNCLCEFDKYERVRLGEGRPRSKYP